MVLLTLKIADLFVEGERGEKKNDVLSLLGNS